MTDATATEMAEKSKGTKKPLIIGLILMVLGGLGGFYAVSAGLILGSESSDSKAEILASDSGFENVAFLPIAPISVSLPPSSLYKHLLFRAELEVRKPFRSEVQKIMPRIVNVLNGYLRAVETADLAEPSSLTRLRTQMLRRAQIVAGPGRVEDLLIMEFVLN